jgi:peptidoglycan/LPS O-acetylase OafA/YrhL
MIAIGLLNDRYNLLRLGYEVEGNIYCNTLYDKFFIFYWGSVIGVAYFCIENDHRDFLDSIKNDRKYMKTILFLLFIGLVVINLKFFCNIWDQIPTTHFKDSRISMIWSAALLALIISSPNAVTTYLNENYWLKTSGKYSFGIYLLHFWPFVLTKVFHFKYSFQKSIIIIAACYFIGMLFYYLVENQLMKISRSACRRINAYFNDLN